MTDLKEWDFSALCFVCGALRVQSRRTDVGGRGCSTRPPRPAVRCEAEIKDDQSLAGPLRYTQQAEVITHMGGADFMTSWRNNGDVDLFLLLCCKNNREARKEQSLSFSEAEIISQV